MKALKVLGTLALAVALTLGGSFAASAKSKPIDSAPSLVQTVYLVQVSYVYGGPDDITNTFSITNTTNLTQYVPYNYAEHAGDVTLAPDEQGTVVVPPHSSVSVEFPRVSLAALQVFPGTKYRLTAVAP